MRFTIGRAPLTRALRLALSATERRGTLPILASTVLRVAGKKLMVVGSDLKVTLLADLPITAGENGGTCIDAKRLHEVVAPLTADDVTVRLVENDRVEIKCGRSKYALAAVPDREYPRVPALPDVAAWTDCDAQDFAVAIDKALVASHKEDTREVMYGVKLDAGTDAFVSASGTDGHRMHLVATAIAPAALPGGVFIPPRGAAEIVRMIGDATSAHIAVHAGHLFVRVEETTVAVKLSEAAFPPTRSHPAAPASYGKVTIEATLDEMVGALKRASTMVAREKGDALCGVAMHFVKGDDTVTITCRHADRGDAHEEVQMRGEWTRPTMSIGLHPGLLVEGLLACGGDVARMALEGDLDPVRMTSADGKTTAVVMPMRL